MYSLGTEDSREPKKARKVLRALLRRVASCDAGSKATQQRTHSKTLTRGRMSSSRSLSPRTISECGAPPRRLYICKKFLLTLSTLVEHTAAVRVYDETQ